MSSGTRKLGRSLFLSAAFLGAVAASAGTANALTININAGAGLLANPAALAAWDRAAQAWENVFTDPVTVNITADLGSFANPNVIGSTSSVFLIGGYDLVRNAMVADAADEPGDSVVASLPVAADFSAFVPVGFSLNGSFVATKANLKALGFDASLLDALAGISDATITFNQAFAFDYDNSNGVGAGLIDFETVAAHEIGHALGFVSAVDDIDFLINQGAPSAMELMPLDLFRFGDTVANGDPATSGEFTFNPRMLVPGVAAHFDDLDNEYEMSTGVFNGDGRQASHWKDDLLTGVLIGIMDPTLGAGVIETIGPADIRALDVIGWDDEQTIVNPVPEPGLVALFCLGLAALGAGRLRAGRRQG